MNTNKSLKHTGRKPPAKPFTGKEGIATRFSKDRQPSPEAKSKGKRKSKLLSELLELSFGGKNQVKMRKAAAMYLGIPESEITIEDVMNFRQIEKSISKSNTFAYNSVMDRAFGKPKQVTEEVGEGRKIVVTIKD
jgi:hypothetical protein